MGVTGLLTLLKSNELGEHVKLADIAAEYRKNTGKRPVLLVDSSSSLMFLNSGKCRGIAAELKKFRKTCEEFLNRFYDLGIQLYIIQDGLKSDFRIQPWKKSTVERIKTLQLAQKTRDISLANERAGYLYQIAMEVFILSDKCEFYRSINEATHYIAQYLKKNGAFGVISNNSDIILMEGSHYFLSIEDLDLSKMTTFNFNRDKLAKFLEIKAQLLPHVGTLCPNVILDHGDLKIFSSKGCGSSVKAEKFKAVADVVAKYLDDFDPEDYSPEKLKYCQSQLYLNDDQLEKYMKRLKILNGEPDEESRVIENNHWNDILTLAKTLHHGGRTERNVLELLLEKRFFCSVGLENINMPMPGEELQNLRRKIYGFLFAEYPEEAYVTEHLFIYRRSFGVKYVYNTVKVERRDHVGLLELWSSDAPENIQRQKYKYFFEIINKKLDPDILIGKVEEEFVLPLLAAFYLHYELGKFDDPISMNAFLIHSILANKLSASEVAEFDCETDFDALNLCGWYLTLIQHLALVNSVCGHPFDRSKTNMVNYLDGLVLQTLYRDLNGGKGIPEEAIPTFKRLKKVLNEMKQCCGL